MSYAPLIVCAHVAPLEETAMGGVAAPKRARRRTTSEKR